MRGVRIAPLIALVTTTRFEGGDKAAEAFLFLGPEADEFQAEPLFLCPPHHGLVNLHRELRSTHDVDAQLVVRIDDDACSWNILEGVNMAVRAHAELSLRPD